MIAATRDTSTRSTPTPIAVTARRSEAEARREPCGGGQVAAQHQSEPYQRHAERSPQGDQRPKRRPPARNRVDLVGPATVLVGNLRLEREPRGLETTRGGAERLLPLRVRRLVENAGLAHARGDRVERVERGHERFAAGGQPGGDRPLLGAREEAAAAQSSRAPRRDRKSTRLNSSHTVISYAVFCLKQKRTYKRLPTVRVNID